MLHINIKFILITSVRYLVTGTLFEETLWHHPN